jgi:N-acetylmuramoyl-L-alanine amidase CwlA
MKKTKNNKKLSNKRKFENSLKRLRKRNELEFSKIEIGQSLKVINKNTPNGISYGKFYEVVRKSIIKDTIIVEVIDDRGYKIELPYLVFKNIQELRNKNISNILDELLPNNNPVTA